jgi:hypothetical protein
MNENAQYFLKVREGNPAEHLYFELLGGDESL